ncbi:MAG: MarR family winged helix-turn-helix transcriptional regulator [Coriobacteriales bacterium]
MAEQNMHLYHELMHVSHLLRHGHGEPGLKVAPGQQRVLSLLGRNGPMPQPRLLEALGVAPATLSELLSKLEGKGLVKRTKSEKDRRVVMVALSPKGTRKAEEIMNTQQSIADEVFEALSAEQRDDLHELLQMLIDNWNEKNKEN